MTTRAAILIDSERVDEDRFLEVRCSLKESQVDGDEETEEVECGD